MNGTGYLRKPFALLLQAMAVLLILVNSTQGYSHQREDRGSKQPLVYVTPAVSIVSREVHDPFSFSFFPVKENPWQENRWQFIALCHSNELHTCPELQVPFSFYNTFYIVPRIHAP